MGKVEFAVPQGPVSQSNSVSRFMKRLVPYFKRTRERDGDYLNSRLADATFEQRLVYELLMDVMDRIEAIEAVLEGGPAMEKPRIEE